MDKNTRIVFGAFGVGIGLSIYRTYQLHKRLWRTEKTVNDVVVHLNERIQRDVDAIFQDIVDNYDN